jgi:hypothetical protein
MLVHARVAWQNSGVCCGIHQQRRSNVNKVHRIIRRIECQDAVLLQAIAQDKKHDEKLRSTQEAAVKASSTK